VGCTWAEKVQVITIEGRPVPTLSNQTTLLHAPAEGHSEKPDAFYALVESLCPGAKLELFAPRRRHEWNTHGAWDFLNAARGGISGNRSPQRNKTAAKKVDR
jgi:N6-adenosine-specific RNA methylase IME4